MGALDGESTSGFGAIEDNGIVSDAGLCNGGRATTGSTWIYATLVHARLTP